MNKVKVEGMGCEAGCIRGPGTLVNPKAASRALSTQFKRKGDVRIGS